MDYRTAWEDMDRWIKQGVEYLEKRLKDLEDRDDSYAQKEYVRIQGKLDGFKTCFIHMNESEKIYKGSDVK